MKSQYQVTQPPKRACTLNNVSMNFTNYTWQLLRRIFARQFEYVQLAVADFTTMSVDCALSKQW